MRGSGFLRRKLNCSLREREDCTLLACYFCYIVGREGTWHSLLDGGNS
jgi:hypothetical protein